MQYDIFIYVSGKWVCAKSGDMSKSLAFGLFSQFKMQYSTRLFYGLNVGKMIAAYYNPTDMLELEKHEFYQNLVNVGF